MTLWTRRGSMLLAAALALATTPYVVAYLEALSNGDLKSTANAQ
jgi:hypothetical protein